MSRLVFYNLEGIRQGEIHAICDRGWALAGSSTVVAGGSTTVTLTKDQAANEWLQFGRLCLVQHDTLPAWVGVVDPPWTGIPPIQMTLYNIEYLLSLRSPEAAYKFTADLPGYVSYILGLANQQEDLGLRQGNADASRGREWTVDTRPIWEQLVDAVTASSQEMSVRPVEENGQLKLYLDTLERTGIDTNFLFHAGGANANMKVVEGVVDGTIRNRMIGTSSLKTGTGRITTEPMIDEDSLQYRMRNEVVEFSNVSEQSGLEQLTQNRLDAVSMPKVRLTVRIRDVGTAFDQIGLGNTALFHAPQMCLPGGVRGWKGLGRMLAISYEEKANAVGLTVEGDL